MDPIRDMYTWTKYMRRKRRWSSRGIVQVRGAELVRAEPIQPVPEQISESVPQAIPEPVPQEIPAPVEEEPVVQEEVRTTRRGKARSSSEDSP